MGTVTAQPAPVVVAAVPAQVATTTVIQQNVQFRDVPVTMVDPATGEQITTRLQYRIGLLTWLIVGILFLCGFWICMCIPCCIQSCMDVDHVNPRTGQIVGTYKRLS